jgi:peptidoglycan hydrolase-like protein with peptidoglycan-binding domain
MNQKPPSNPAGPISASLRVPPEGSLPTGKPDREPERPNPYVKRWLTVPRPKVPVRLLSAILVLALLTVLVIVWVMSGQQSPDDVRRARRAPIMKPITAKLVRQVLEVSFMDAQASYRYSDPRPVTLAGSLAKSGATQVVTQAPVDGQTISDNRVVMNVAGRPVISLQVNPISASGLPCVDPKSSTNAGANEPTKATTNDLTSDTTKDLTKADDRVCAVVPMYRDLRLGDRGQDVAQLQSALQRLGFLADVNGRFETTTSTAVATWYTSLGLEPFDPTETNPSAKAGVMVPANEVLFFGELPQRVDEVNTVVGGTISSNPAFTASGTKLVVASQIPVEKRQYVRVGMKVSLVDQNSAVSRGTVSSVATKPGGAASDGLYAVEIATDASLPNTGAVVAGLPVTVNYPVTRSSEPLLTVPVTGLFPCSNAEPGTECLRVTNDSAAAFYEVRVVRIMTSSNGLVGFNQAVASVSQGDVVLINNPAPSTSEASPGPEDLGEYSIAPSTVPA